MENQNDKKFISVEELGEMLGISKSQAYKLILSSGGLSEPVFVRLFDPAFAIR